MEKIPTLFERDETTRKITDKFAVPLAALSATVVTEKVDGMNVRLTVRGGRCVRVERRRNPTKQQKATGIVEPWYVDVLDTPKEWEAITQRDGADPAPIELPKDVAYLVDAAQHTPLGHLEDGEYSGEAVGPSLQGNPLELEQREVVVFSDPQTRWVRLTFDVRHGPLLSYEGIRDWLANSESLLSPGHPMEGIVFWTLDEYLGGRPVAKIKRKDFPA